MQLVVPEPSIPPGPASPQASGPSGRPALPAGHDGAETLPVAHEDDVGVQQLFDAATAAHTMTVLHDDGPYRHLRFSAPAIRSWSWDIVTWPGALVISGDIGDGWQFTGAPDMFDFFQPFAGRHRINPVFCVEWTPARLRRAATVFSPRRLERAVRAELAGRGLTEEQQFDALGAMDAAGVFGIDDRGAALKALEGPWPAGAAVVDLSDVSELDIDEWNPQFLLALFAIEFGVERYRDHEASIADADGLPD